MIARLRMIFHPILILCCLVSPLRTRSIETFKSRDNTSTCVKCKPGEFRNSSCDGPDNIIQYSVCFPCPNGTFQSNWTQATSCEECKTKCIALHSSVISTCSKTNNLICQCDEGYWRKLDDVSTGSCLKHTVCNNGSVVSKNGTHDTDVECKKCENGMFYVGVNGTHPEHCKKCSTCACAESVKEPCNSMSDTVCYPSSSPSNFGLSGSAIALIIGSLVLAGVLVYLVKVRSKANNKKPKRKEDQNNQANNKKPKRKEDQNNQTTVNNPERESLLANSATPTPGTTGRNESEPENTDNNSATPTPGTTGRNESEPENTDNNSTTPTPGTTGRNESEPENTDNNSTTPTPGTTGRNESEPENTDNNSTTPTHETPGVNPTGTENTANNSTTPTHETPGVNPNGTENIDVNSTTTTHGTPGENETATQYSGVNVTDHEISLSSSLGQTNE